MMRWILVSALLAATLLGCTPRGGRPGGARDDDDVAGPDDDDTGPADDDDGGPDNDDAQAIEGVTTVAELFTPFDVNRSDLNGPRQVVTSYGKAPEIIAVINGDSIEVLAQDYSDPSVQRVVLFRLEPSLDDFVITAAIEPPMLDRVMGLAHDDAGYLYVATATIEALHQEITVEYPPPGLHREGIVRVVKLGWNENVLFDTDLDIARQDFSSEAVQLIRPMRASTGRLAWGDGSLALVQAMHTTPDENGTRHQKASTTHLDASSGEVTRVESIWVSHSFDQRLFHDGRGFVETHLGDAYPRALVFARVSEEESSGGYPLFHIKGSTGENTTRTRLGGVALIEEDPIYGYIALFAAETTAGTDAIIPPQWLVAGSRELGIVRVRRDFETTMARLGEHIDPALPDEMTIDPGGFAGEQTNRMRWLTDYRAVDPGVTNAERPKLIAIGGDRYILLWERWDLVDTESEFAATFGMVIDAEGNALVPAAEVSGSHLPRGDDAFAWDGGAAWLTGDREARELHLHLVDESLGYRRIVIE
jgi:hypothetical protein